MTTIPLRTFHCHTIWSDGRDQPADLIAAAVAKGFTALGISDHLVLHPTLGPVSWSMPESAIGPYLEDLRRCAAAAPIPVRVGLEVDFFPDPAWSRQLDRILAIHQPDYLIGSVHYVDTFNIDGRADDWRPLTPTTVQNLHQAYWQRIAQLAADDRFAFIGHLDLPKKFAFLPIAPPQNAIETALEALIRHRRTIEYNARGFAMPCAEGYPGLDLLRTLALSGVPVLVNDDAHQQDGLGGHYQQAARMLTAAGYPEASQAAGWLLHQPTGASLHTPSPDLARMP